MRSRLGYKISQIHVCVKISAGDLHLEYTYVYTMQAVIIMFLMYFLAKLNTSLSSLGWCQKWLWVGYWFSCLKN